MSEIPSQEIVNRIFEAIEILKEEKTIPGIVYLIEKHNLPKTRMYSLKAGNEKPKDGFEYKNIPLETIYILAKEYDFSLEWIIFGIGKPKKKYNLDD